MPYRSVIPVLAALAFALAPLGVAAQARATDPGRGAEVANREEILDILEELVASITDSGIAPFDGLSFPFMIIKGGDVPGIAVIQNASEMGEPGEPVLILSDAEIHLLGEAAVAEFVYGPAHEPRARAVAFAVFHRPGEVWLAKALGLAPATPLAEPSTEEPDPDAVRPLTDRDVVSALLGSYVKMLTTTGPQEFSGLQAPFIYLEGAAATFVLYARSADFPAPGERLDLDPRDIRASVLPGLAMAGARLYGPEDYSDLRLLCIRAEWGWQVIMACHGPVWPIEEPDESEGER